MKYQQYSVKDFVLDEHFQQWVLTQDPEAVNFWKNWLRQNPDKREVVEEARALILEMDFEKTTSTSKEYRDVWQNIDKEVEQYEKIRQTSTPVYHLPKWKPALYKVAAAFIGFALVSAVYFLATNFNNETTYTTAFGETKEITLPDQSTIILNANSTLRYNNNWTSQQTREVWLEGEAYFTVTHTENDQKFLVHTQNLEVEVLGTQFNVNNRRGKTEVVLNSGKVKLNLDKDKKEEIFMDPGDLVAYSAENQNYERKQINAEVYTSWKNNLLIFENKTLGDIASTLEDNHGITIQFASPEISQKRFTATIPVDNIEVLFTMLSSSFGIEKDGNTIFIQKKTDSPL